VTVTAEQLAQWKALAREVPKFPQLNYYWEVNELCLAVPALIEALGEAQRDTKRLDWLEDSVGWSETDQPNISIIAVGIPYREGLREAIDAAQVSPPEEER
jgi:hypothetical protein